MCAMIETILRYGEYLTDVNIQDNAGDFIRIRTIKYNGSIYYLEMKNGKENNFMKIGKSY